MPRVDSKTVRSIGLLVNEWRGFRDRKNRISTPIHPHARKSVEITTAGSNRFIFLCGLYGEVLVVKASLKAMEAKWVFSNLNEVNDRRPDKLPGRRSFASHK
jgi:hypothetical protein